jgi:hypothetical protein
VIGVIASDIFGDILGGIVPVLMGAIYYVCTGDLLTSYRVLPT